MATQTRLSHEIRQQQIVDAARDLVARGGADALTVRAIADRVGLTEAAIYRHIPSKEDVLLLLLEDVRGSLFKVISDATLEDRSPLEKLEHMLQLHLSYVELRRGISFIVTAEAAQFQEPRVRDAGRRLVYDYLGLVEKVVAEGIERGEIDEFVSPPVAATMFFGMIQAAVTKWLFDATVHPLAENAGAMWVTYRSALEPRSPRRNGD